MISIRPGESGDHDAVLKLWESTDLGKAAPDEWNALINGPTSAILIAEDGDEVIGTAIATYDGWRAYIYHVAVAVPRRREGIARRLMDEAEQHLIQAGARYVYVMVGEHRTDGLALVTGNGYLPEGDVVLAKRLAVRVAM